MSPRVSVVFPLPDAGAARSSARAFIGKGYNAARTPSPPSAQKNRRFGLRAIRYRRRSNAMFVRYCSRSAPGEIRRDRFARDARAGQAIIFAVVGDSRRTSQPDAQPFPKRPEPSRRDMLPHIGILTPKGAARTPSRAEGAWGAAISRRFGASRIKVKKAPFRPFLLLVRKTGLEPARDCSR